MGEGVEIGRVGEMRVGWGFHEKYENFADLR